MYNDRSINGLLIEEQRSYIVPFPFNYRSVSFNLRCVGIPHVKSIGYNQLHY